METLDPAGTVWVHGEIWRAESLSGKINPGEKVRVAEIKNLGLRVVPVKT
jgi:membrane-bound serine protease (ClpP class)